jgi:multimeric flavodoxin WrbA
MGGILKILSIIGSSRRKSTFKAVKLFEDEFGKNGNSDFQYLFLSEADLGFCRGCGLCVEDEMSCPLKDGWIGLYERIKDADLVIFASPVYENGVTALMKNFYDRFHFLGFRPLSRPIDAVILSVCSFSGLKNTLEYMRWAAASFGFKVKGCLGFTTGRLYDDNEKERLKLAIGRIYRKAVSSGTDAHDGKPGLYELSIFKDQKERITNVRDKYPKAYEYWKRNGWLDKDYFHDINVNPFARIMLKFMNQKIGRN